MEINSLYARAGISASSSKTEYIGITMYENGRRSRLPQAQRTIAGAPGSNIPTTAAPHLIRCSASFGYRGIFARKRKINRSSFLVLFPPLCSRSRALF
jgi:hypothetical protein